MILEDRVGSRMPENGLGLIGLFKVLDLFLCQFDMNTLCVAIDQGAIRVSRRKNAHR